MSNRKSLFQPITVNNVRIKNRIVMPGMLANFAGLDGSLTRNHFNYFINRAKGGVGLIITEAVSVSFPEGKSEACQLRMRTEDTLPIFRKLTDAVHAYGTRIIPQIQHGGALAKPEFNHGVQSVSASDFMGARALTTDEIHKIVQDYVETAMVAQKAGFDGVELHGAHTYLINQFLSPYSNHRTDEYGGSVENRYRFLGEIIRGIKKACPDHFILDVRLASDEDVPGGITPEDSIAFAKMCEADGADLLNLTTGFCQGIKNVPSQWEKEGCLTFLGERIKKEVKIPVAVVGKLRTSAYCAELLENGVADFVCIGRQLICDPEWPNKVLFGKENEIRTCLNCMDGCIDQTALYHNGMCCAINPYIGYEDLYNEHAVPKTGSPKNIVVVGGGVAGMQFSIISRQRGNHITLLEKTERLGGQMILAGETPYKEDMMKALKWFASETDRVGVDVRLNTEATPELIKSLHADVVVLAMGDEPSKPPIPGIENAIDGWKVIDDQVTYEKGSNLAIIGGGVVGCELAHKLIDEGNAVTIFEMQPELCIGHELVHRQNLVAYLNEHATVEISAAVQEIEKRSVTFINSDQEEKCSRFDAVLNCTGQHPVSDSLYEALIARGMEVYKIGDWIRPSNLRMTTSSAMHMAYRI